jgi:hypothetical protein
MDSGSARGFAPDPGDASGGGAIRQSSADAADVDRPRQRDVLKRAEALAPLPTREARMLPRFIRASSSDFEARLLLLQSALPGTRRLFAKVISRMDEPRKSVRSRGWG